MAGFLNEARTIAHLVHPHIVRVTDFGIEGDTPFLVMDYAPNGTLRQRHPKGTQLPLSLIIPYVKQVSGALQHAHNEKLVHRDIKPENMLLGRQNELLLSDFGIALVAQSSRYPSPQEIVGTAAYMSSEQATFVRPWPAPQIITPAPPGPYVPPIYAPIHEQSMPPYGIPSSGSAQNYPAQAELALGTAGQEKLNVWNIGKRQLVAMAVGALLFAALFFLSSLFGLIYFASIASIALACVTLLFLGTVFGPWAGLFTGVGGLLIVGLLENQRIFDIFFGKLELGFAIGGFIAGLTLFITRGRYNNAQAIATAGGISITGSFIGTYIAYFPYIGILDLISFSVIPSLVLLPASLATYNAIVNRLNRA